MSYYYPIKPWEELTLQDDYMFKLIMSRKRICRKMLEMLLNIKIKDLKYIDKEKTIKSNYESKGVRLDVYVEDDVHTVYNIEMQVRKPEGEGLFRRTRYYQSMIDADLLDRGMDYDTLNDCYIIFICPFDPVGEGRHVYTFKNYCTEDKNIDLKDGATKIFFNTKAEMDDVSSEVKAFLDYVDSAIVSNDKFVQEINEEIKKVKQIEKERKGYMTYEMKIREWKKEGIEEGKMAVALRLIKEKLDLSFIMRVTELSADDIRKIAAKNGLSVVG